MALVQPVYRHGSVSMIHLRARFSPSCPPSELILNSHWEFIFHKGKLPAGINPAQLLPRPATLLAPSGRGLMAQGIFSCLAISSLACGIIHWGKLPGSNSQSVLASQASRTKHHKREMWRAAPLAWGQLCMGAKRSECQLLPLLPNVWSTPHSASPEVEQPGQGSRSLTALMSPLWPSQDCGFLN